MLYDRPYMQQTWSSGFRRTLHWLIGINLAVFVLQTMLSTWAGSYFIQQYFSLSIPALKSGYLWTLVSYSFLHQQGLLHIGLNLLIIFLVGRVLESSLSGRQLLTLYLCSAVGGGLLWLASKSLLWAIHGFPPAVPVVGASAAAYGLLIYFCCLQPNQPITLLLFFVLPVTIKPKWIAAILVAFDGFGFLFFEMSHGPGERSNIAHSAHLGGMAAAWLLYHFVGSRHWQGGWQRNYSQQGAESWLKRKLRRKPKPIEQPKFTLHMSNRKELKHEVDRILDKINEKGFAALSDDEKRTLDKARDILG